MFSCEFCGISNNTFFTEYLRETTSVCKDIWIFAFIEVTNSVKKDLHFVLECTFTGISLLWVALNVLSFLFPYTSSPALTHGNWNVCPLLLLLTLLKITFNIRCDNLLAKRLTSSCSRILRLIRIETCGWEKCIQNFLVFLTSCVKNFITLCKRNLFRRLKHNSFPKLFIIHNISRLKLVLTLLFQI